MKRLFGTDGIRGEAGQFPLDAATVTAAGRSLVRRLGQGRLGSPQIVTGRDTRESGEWIERAFTEGVLSAGGRAASAGVITTPGVAFLARSMPADAGVVISASHNPFHDNGIKVFAPDGRKLDDATERLVEADIYAERESGAPPADFDEAAAPPGGDDPAGYAKSASALRASYLDHLAEVAAAGLRLDGLKVVVDCANGAASELAPALLRRLGAEVVSTFDAPDGRNINLDCGSLHTEHLAERVVEEGAHLGVAFDGDADRALFADARGRAVDGDATLWVLARRMRERGELEGGRVVATVMSNIGLEIALRSLGVELLRADVGDKYVLEELLRTGSTLGGEQSGHIIFPRLSLAGDGMLTTVNLLRAVVESGRPLDELTEGFTRYPQVLVNVRVREKVPFDEVAEVAGAAREVRERLGDSGRLLLRYSGTETLARVMIEGRSQGEIDALAEGLAGVIRGRLGEG
jgi:phosphoglucosamine mutase